MRESLETVCPIHLDLLPTKRSLGGPLKQALADDEEIGMLGIQGRIVDLGAPLPPLVVGDFRQLAPHVDQLFGEPGLIENPERARMDREGVAVLPRPRVRIDDLHAQPLLLQKQGGDQTDRTGTDDEDLRLGVTEHRASSTMLRAKMRTRACGPVTAKTPLFCLRVTHRCRPSVEIPAGHRGFFRSNDTDGARSQSAMAARIRGARPPSCVPATV